MMKTALPSGIQPSPARPGSNLVAASTTTVAALLDGNRGTARGGDGSNRGGERRVFCFGTIGVWVACCGDGRFAGAAEDSADSRKVIWMHIGGALATTNMALDSRGKIHFNPPTHGTLFS